MVYGIIAALLAAGDQLLKSRIEAQEPERFPRPLPKTKGKILLYRNHNAGFPFGFLEKHEELVRTIPLAVTSVLAGMLTAISEKKGNVLRKTALAVMIGGSVSNLIDRYTRGYVIDYFSMQCGALKKVVFNLGDLCVFLGSAILLGTEAAAEAGISSEKETIDSKKEIL